MTARGLDISAEAWNEVAEAIAYIAAESSANAAARWLEGLEEVFESLREMPERFPIAPENRRVPNRTIRRALYHRYRILFQVDDTHVRVLRVRHGMRDELRNP